MNTEWKDIKRKKIYKKKNIFKNIDFQLINRRLALIIEKELDEISKYNIYQNDDINYGKWIIV